MFEVLKHRLQDPSTIAIVGAVTAAAGTGAAVYSATRKPAQIQKPPAPPSQDTAANSALQQQKDMLRRRGVLANIYAGGQAPTPTTAGKQMLGN